MVAATICCVPFGTRDEGEGVAHEMGATALPARPLQRGGDGTFEPLVTVAHHQVDAGQPSGDQAAQEGEPEGAVLTRL